ncbi:hypothetical protein ALT761_02561 [Alteromonas sp. 76-1]|nr:hypothetical protein ALT761_02561 [Alteromonas sp. 76-1]
MSADVLFSAECSVLDIVFITQHYSLLLNFWPLFDPNISSESERKDIKTFYMLWDFNKMRPGVGKSSTLKISLVFLSKKLIFSLQLVYFRIPSRLLHNTLQCFYESTSRTEPHVQ